MNPLLSYRNALSRRQFLGRTATGIGSAALASLLNREASAAGTPLPSLPHFAAKAKRVIYLFQAGAPSQLDLFDYKPKLAEWHGREIPDEIVGQQKLTQNTKAGSRPLLGDVAKFAQHGKSGAWVSHLMPHTAGIADELCFIKSMHTEEISHPPGVTFILTGNNMPGRPSLGAWLDYGLGSDSEDLPAYVVLTSRDKDGSCGQLFYDYYWGSGFLPSKHQGVQFREGGDPVLYLSNPQGVSREMRRGLLDDLVRLNELKLEDYGDSEIATRISQYEMAYRMQTSVPELTDLSKEPSHVLDAYGPDARKPGTYAHNCVLARRMAERGVRFIQLMHAGWDHHGRIYAQMETQCQDTDQPSAALVMDLKQRGLLDDTLVIWGGEFGRTPFIQGKMEQRKSYGRDHHPYAFTTWMAGGGVKPGTSYGTTDEFGFNSVTDKVHIHDFQATVMRLLGIDHERFTYRFQGRDYRLTDVFGHVVKDIIA